MTARDPKEARVGGRGEGGPGESEAAPLASAALAGPPVERGTARPLRYRVAFFLTALVVLSLVVTLPFSVKSVVDDVLGPAMGRVHQVAPWISTSQDRSVPERPPARDGNYTKLHVAPGGVDEVRLLDTLRVSGHHRCAGCAWSHRVRLVAVSDDDASAEGWQQEAQQAAQSLIQADLHSTRR